ncbi:GTPase Era [Anaerotardibacter muris]|uniref:GTPase Era n=1 Tax=Anaerotardibacter muris TaxID=2941505 RepID=UPI00203B430E|nr:GTPase Era [Anaerotardibacter muris]
MDNKDFRSGFVTLLGRPNAGKSTLLNAIMDQKYAIASPTAQTTRHRFRAIKTTDDYQLIIVDTPGVHKPHDALGEELNTTALKSLEGIDVIAFLLDAHEPLGRGDEWVITQLKAVKNTPKILVISKSDLATEDQIEAQIAKANELMEWDDTIVLSAVTGYHVDEFIDTVVSYLPEGPLWFPADMQTDQPQEVIIAEFIREKILFTVHDEVPHAIGVVVDEMSYDRKKDLYRIFATIYVERDSQKGILVGKGGRTIKHIGIEARKDLESLLGTKVFLDLQVKVKKNWRRDLNLIRRFGYGEGA